MNKPLIYGLLLSILMVIAPHANHLPLWINALCAALLVLLTSLKFLELRNTCDAMVLIYLA